MSAAAAQSNCRRVRLLLRKRYPELAGRLNTAVRTLPCGPDCRLHPAGRASLPEPRHARRDPDRLAAAEAEADRLRAVMGGPWADEMFG
jgi:hypothetical protein